MASYYNEFDPFAAAWLKELIKDGLIADGIVDERSIADVQPEDLRGFTQCHFFAGIGGWSAAARLAGWSDDRPMWTGSPPCQPFSTAGNRKGQDDERHLWPAFFNLIRECAPPVVFGEQVAAAIRTGWFDDLQTDMEAEGYATAMVVLPACSVGAPHKRDRLWYVAERLGNAEHNGQHGLEVGRGTAKAGNNNEERAYIPSESQGASRPAQPRDICNGRDTSPLADTNDSGQPGQGKLRRSSYTAEDENREVNRAFNVGSLSNIWKGSEYIYCRDGKERQIPVEPALFPLADGVSNRVGILRGAGNAIVPQVAAEVIGGYISSEVCK